MATIKGDVFTFKFGDRDHGGTIKVDAGKTPKSIDLIPGDGPQKGKAILGVYEIKDDVLCICHAEPGKDRPTEVSSKQGTGWTVMTLKRVKK